MGWGETILNNYGKPDVKKKQFCIVGSFFFFYIFSHFSGEENLKKKSHDHDHDQFLHTFFPFLKYAVKCHQIFSMKFAVVGSNCFQRNQQWKFFSIFFNEIRSGNFFRFFFNKISSGNVFLIFFH